MTGDYFENLPLDIWWNIQALRVILCHITSYIDQRNYLVFKQWPGTVFFGYVKHMNNESCDWNSNNHAEFNTFILDQLYNVRCLKIMQKLRNGQITVYTVEQRLTLSFNHKCVPSRCTFYFLNHPNVFSPGNAVSRFPRPNVFCRFPLA